MHISSSEQMQLLPASSSLVDFQKRKGLHTRFVHMDFLAFSGSGPTNARVTFSRGVVQLYSRASPLSQTAHIFAE